MRLAITYHAVDNRRHAIIFIAEQVMARIIGIAFWVAFEAYLIMIVIFVLCSAFYFNIVQINFIQANKVLYVRYADVNITYSHIWKTTNIWHSLSVTIYFIICSDKNEKQNQINYNLYSVQNAVEMRNCTSSFQTQAREQRKLSCEKEKNIQSI